MDLNENDLLYTNEFIKTPELEGEVPSQFNEEFRKYYKTELEKQKEEQLKQNVEKISLLDMSFNEDTDPLNIENTNKFSGMSGSGVEGIGTTGVVARIQREFKTYVNIDSRDRDRLKYPNPNNFKIFLGKTFYNVSTIRLASLEFPNSNNVINNSNNKIYWRNKYDIDNGIIDEYTNTYPIYEIQLDNGNYTVNSLRTQVNKKSAVVKRDGTNYINPYYHNITLDIILASNQTDLSSIRYVKLQDRPLVAAGPFTVSLDLAEYPNIRIPLPGETIHLSGVVVGDGSSSDFLNGRFTIVYVENTTKIFFNVTSLLPLTNGIAFGGPNVVYGIEEPFQLLFGDREETIRQILGFPPQNSADPIVTNLETESVSIVPGNTIVNSLSSYGITSTNSVSVVNIGGDVFRCAFGNINSINWTSSGTFDEDLVYIGNTTLNNVVITISFNTSRAILPSIRINNGVDSGPLSTSGTTHTFTFNDTLVQNDFYRIILGSDQDYTNVIITNFKLTINYAGILENNDNTLVVTTKEPHNFTSNDIGNSIVIYDAPYIPSLEKSNKIVNVLSDKQFVIEGNIDFVFDQLTYNHQYKGTGYFYTQHPLKTIAPEIHSCTYTSSTKVLEIRTKTRHYLNNDDNVKINNIITSPDIIRDQIFTISNASEDPASGIFTFEITLPSDIDGDNIDISNANVGTSLMELTCQNHGFNEVTGIGLSENGVFINLRFNDNLQATESRAAASAGWVTNPTVILYGTNTQLDANPFGLEKTGSRLPIEPSGNIITLPIIDIDQQDIDAIDLSQVQYRTKDKSFYLYNVKVDRLVHNGITETNINNNKFTIRELLDEHHFIFELNNYYSSSVEKFGGDLVFISSALHGFKGVQSNKLFEQVYRKVALNGENYVFLKCPQLATMLNTGSVENIFARILLDQFPGNMVFSFLSNPKVFTEAPLNKLEELDFSIVQYNNELYNFNDLDYSFVLEVTEVQDTIENANFSSRRGVSIVNQNPYVSQGQLGYTPQPNAQYVEPSLPKPGDF